MRLLISFIFCLLVVGAFSQTQYPQGNPITNAPQSWISYGYTRDSAHLFIARDTFNSRYPAIVMRTDGTMWRTLGNGAYWYALSSGGNSIQNGGNSFGAPIIIGTNDSNAVIIRTKGINRWSISPFDGRLTYGATSLRGDDYGSITTGQGYFARVSATDYISFPKDTIAHSGYSDVISFQNGVPYYNSGGVWHAFLNDSVLYYSAGYGLNLSPTGQFKVDTSKILPKNDSGYLYVTPTQLSLKVNKSDSGIVFATPTKVKNDSTTIMGYVNGKVNYTDTSTILSPYQTALNARVKYTDSTIKYATPTQLALKVNKSDSSLRTGYVTPTVLTNDSITLANQIATKEPIISPSNTIKQYWNGYKQFVNFNTDSIPQGSTNKYFVTSDTAGLSNKLNKSNFIDSLTGRNATLLGNATTGSGSTIVLSGSPTLTLPNIAAISVSRGILSFPTGGSDTVALRGDTTTYFYPYSSNPKNYTSLTSLSATRKVSTGSIFTYNNVTGAYNFDTTVYLRKQDSTLYTTPTALNNRISSITLNTSNITYNNPVNFTNTGGAWSGTLALANQSPYTVFSRASGIGTPSWNNQIDSNYWNGQFATQVRAAQQNNSGFTTGQIVFPSSSSALTGSSNLFWDNTNNRLGLLTNLPTHTLTLASTSTGISYYNTSDQTTNYERVRQFWSGNIYYIIAEQGGSGSYRNINISSAGSLVFTNTVQKMIITGTTVTGAINMGYSTGTAGSIIGSTATLTASSGNQNNLALISTVNQTSSASSKILWISPYYQGVGSGSQLLIDAGTNTAANGGGTHTSKFNVDTSGNTTAKAFIVSGSSSSYLLQGDGSTVLKSSIGGGLTGNGASQSAGVAQIPYFITANSTLSSNASFTFDTTNNQTLGIGSKTSSGVGHNNFIGKLFFYNGISSGNLQGAYISSTQVGTLQGAESIDFYTQNGTIGGQTLSAQFTTGQASILGNVIISSTGTTANTIASTTLGGSSLNLFGYNSTPSITLNSGPGQSSYSRNINFQYAGTTYGLINFNPNTNNINFGSTSSTGTGYWVYLQNNGVNTLGVYSGGQVLIQNGGTFSPNGVDALQIGGSALSTQYKLSALNTAPATSSSTGTLGEIRFTSGYIYLCTATNTWVRAALSSF